ncbi:MAG: sugar phosphate nucleotidyltransferase [Flavobacteriaceae bacterium]
MKHNTLLILAAGASSRMKNSLKDTSDFKGKALMPLGEGKQPVLSYLLQNAKSVGYQKIILVVGKEVEAFKSFIQQLKGFEEIEFVFATQHIPNDREKPLGTADAVYQTMEQYPELKKRVFTVCNSDNVYSAKAFALLQNSTAKNAFISYDRAGLDFPSERIRSFALVIQNEAGFLKTIIEKPPAEAMEDYKDATGVLRVSMNIWKLNGADAFPYFRDCPLHPVRNEKELPLAVLHMVAAGIEIKGIPLKEHVPDLTRKEDIEKLEKYLT